MRKSDAPWCAAANPPCEVRWGQPSGDWSGMRWPKTCCSRLPAARADFFKGPEVGSLSNTLAAFASAIHAYDVTDALTYVKDGKELLHYQR